jgi:Domain of unknown function (DUF6458)
MGIGASIFLIAIGAIFTFALEVELSGLDLDVVGIILMVVGLIGLLTTLLFWGPRRRGAPRLVEESDWPVVEERTTYERPVDRRTTTYERPVERRVYDDRGSL